MSSSNSIFVGNLTWATNSEQLYEFARSAGTVICADVKRHEDTARSKGWGLITFSDPATAEAAVAMLNGQELNGRAVHVRIDRANSDYDDSYSIFVGNLPWALTSKELLKLFQSFYPLDCQILTNMYGKSRGFAIVKFSKETDANRAIDAMNGMQVNGRNIECRFDRGPGGKTEDTENNRTSVFVGKLGFDVTDEQLAGLFRHLGPVVHSRVARYPDGRSKGWGVVRFEEYSCARAAVDTMNGTIYTPGGTPIKVHIDRKQSLRHSRIHKQSYIWRKAFTFTLAG